MSKKDKNSVTVDTKISITPEIQEAALAAARKIKTPGPDVHEQALAAARKIGLKNS